LLRGAELSNGKNIVNFNDLIDEQINLLDVVVDLQGADASVWDTLLEKNCVKNMATGW
jgi:hypothetical protein